MADSVSFSLFIFIYSLSLQIKEKLEKEKREKILIEEWLNEKTKKIENYFERIGELEKDKQNVCFKQSLQYIYTFEIVYD